MPRKLKYEFTPEQIQALVRRYEEGESLRSIARTETGGSLNCIRRTLTNGGAVIRKRGRPVGTTGIPRRPNKPKVVEVAEEKELVEVTPEPESSPDLPDLNASRNW